MVVNCIYNINQPSLVYFLMDITTLIKEAKHGSTAAQKALFDMFADKMLLLCCRYVKRREDAEELLLDGFYKFFKSINECLMFLRKKNVFTIVTESAAEEIVLEEEALNNLSADEIFNLIVTLPVGYRTVFNLFVVEGMEHKEIAVLMGISEGTSKSQLSKARALLQKLLSQKGIEYVKQKAL